MWSSWLERTLRPRDTAEYVATRDERARAYARIVEEPPRAMNALPRERVGEAAMCCDAL
jgi:hypothetical protein